ncbi:hypothetical protein SVIOM74S_08674 [Streptomyces violarus]
MVLSVTPGPVLTPSAPSPALPEESALELQPVPASNRAATAAARSDVVRMARGVWCVWCEDFTGWAPWLVRLTRVAGTGRRHRRAVGRSDGCAGGRAGAGPDRDPISCLLGVPFGAEERLWYLGLALFAITWFTARGLLRGRPGRALVALRDSETAAAVMGVDVSRYRSAAFVVSSMYAGLAGVMLALAFRRVVPDYFGLVLSVDYLAMIVIGGLGSVAGATAGAVFVTALPLLMTRYADQLPLVAAPGTTDGAVGPTEAARYLYGAAIVLILLFAPDGLHGLVRRLRARLRSRRTAPPPADAASPSQPPASAVRAKEPTP